jgi:hypothetical protein
LFGYIADAEIDTAFMQAAGVRDLEAKILGSSIGATSRASPRSLATM